MNDFNWKDSLEIHGDVNSAYYEFTKIFTNIRHDQMTNQGHLDQISLYRVDGGHPCISNVNTAFQTKL